MEYSGAETLPFDLHHSPTTSISDPPCSVASSMQWGCEHRSFQMHRCKQTPKTQNDFPLETMQYIVSTWIRVCFLCVSTWIHVCFHAEPQNNFLKADCLGNKVKMPFLRSYLPEILIQKFWNRLRSVHFNKLSPHSQRASLYWGPRLDEQVPR